MQSGPKDAERRSRRGEGRDAAHGLANGPKPALKRAFGVARGNAPGFPSPLGPDKGRYRAMWAGAHALANGPEPAPDALLAGTRAAGVGAEPRTPRPCGYPLAGVAGMGVGLMAPCQGVPGDTSPCEPSLRKGLGDGEHIPWQGVSGALPERGKSFANAAGIVYSDTRAEHHRSPRENTPADQVRMYARCRTSPLAQQ